MGEGGGAQKHAETNTNPYQLLLTFRPLVFSLGRAEVADLLLDKVVCRRVRRDHQARDVLVKFSWLQNGVVARLPNS